MEKKGEKANWKKKKKEKYVKRKRKKELYSRYYNKWIKRFRVTKLLPKIEKKNSNYVRNKCRKTTWKVMPETASNLCWEKNKMHWMKKYLQDETDKKEKSEKCQRMQCGKTWRQKNSVCKVWGTMQGWRGHLREKPRICAFPGCTARGKIQNEATFTKQECDRILKVMLE